MPFFSGKMAECDVSLELMGVVSFLSDPNPLLCKVESLVFIFGTYCNFKFSA